MTSLAEVEQAAPKFKVINTRRLQFAELVIFMNEEHGAVYDGVGFTNPFDETQYAFNAAVVLFNTRKDKDIDPLILDSIKLRYCKKQKRVICTSHLVKPTKNFVEDAVAEGANPFDAVYEIMKRSRLR